MKKVVFITGATGCIGTHLVNANLKIDIIVENEIVLELKSVEIMLPLFSAQLLSYLRLTEKKLVLLINFNVPKLIDGFKRIANNL